MPRRRPPARSPPAARAARPPSRGAGRERVAARPGRTRPRARRRRATRRPPARGELGRGRRPPGRRRRGPGARASVGERRRRRATSGSRARRRLHRGLPGDARAGGRRAPSPRCAVPAHHDRAQRAPASIRVDAELDELVHDRAGLVALRQRERDDEPRARAPARASTGPVARERAAGRRRRSAICVEPPRARAVGRGDAPRRRAAGGPAGGGGRRRRRSRSSSSPSVVDEDVRDRRPRAAADSPSVTARRTPSGSARRTRPRRVRDLLAAQLGELRAAARASSVGRARCGHVDVDLDEQVAAAAPVRATGTPRPLQPEQRAGLGARRHRRAPRAVERLEREHGAERGLRHRDRRAVHEVVAVALERRVRAARARVT